MSAQFIGGRILANATSIIWFRVAYADIVSRSSTHPCGRNRQVTFCLSASKKLHTPGHKHEALSLAQRGGDSKSPGHRDGRRADEDFQLFTGKLARPPKSLSACLGLQYDGRHHALLVRLNQDRRGLLVPQP